MPPPLPALHTPWPVCLCSIQHSSLFSLAWRSSSAREARTPEAPPNWSVKSGCSGERVLAVGESHPPPSLWRFPGPLTQPALSIVCYMFASLIGVLSIECRTCHRPCIFAPMVCRQRTARSLPLCARAVVHHANSFPAKGQVPCVTWCRRCVGVGPRFQRWLMIPAVLFVQCTVGSLYRWGCVGHCVWFSA
jgi:hypothetical protein